MGEGESSGSTPQPWMSYNTVYTNAKAGMDGVDREKVQRVVYEMSKGSKYFENEERKEAFIKRKIDAMRLNYLKITPTDLGHFQTVADNIISELEASRDLSRIWLHVDMDAFYASVETLSNPSLEGKPMAVGSLSMISTANYEARRFGVRAAMPGFIARKLCPQLIFVPTDSNKYTFYSDWTRKVFEKYDPNYMASSLDEAYLDITTICNDTGYSSEAITEELRKAVLEETGLTCSAGVAPNRLLAKVCSDINKPNGQFILANDRLAVMTFISSLPVRKVGGIGRVTERILADVLGIITCEDILKKRGVICALFSHTSTEFFLSAGLGIGQTGGSSCTARKSISNERTFSATEDKTKLFEKLSELVCMLVFDLKRGGLKGRTLTLKLKTSSFEVRTRSVTLQRHISTFDDIIHHASKLLKAELPASLRLIGLKLSQFDEEKTGESLDPTQKTLTRFIIPKQDFEENADENSHTDADVYYSSEEQAVKISDYSGEESCHYLQGRLLDNCPFSFDSDRTRKRAYSLLNNDLLQTIKGCDLGRADGMPFSSSGEVYSPFLEMEPHFWVDGYKCYLCGIEIPSNFVEERQEHSDFHLAQFLQGEELGSKDSLKWQSCGNKDNKKKKIVSDRHKLPTIDTFFDKCSKNK